VVQAARTIEATESTATPDTIRFVKWRIYPSFLIDLSPKRGKPTPPELQVSNASIKTPEVEHFN